MVPPQLAGVGTLAAFNGDGVGFRPVSTEEAVTDTIIAIRRETGGEIVKGPRFIEEIIFDHTIFVAGTTGVEAHLEVLIVNVNMVKGEFNIGEDTEPALPAGSVFNSHIPELHIVIDRDKKELFRFNSLVRTEKFRIGKTMPALVDRLV